MSTQTIVGSWPHRRALPEGREAVERALRLCMGRRRMFQDRRWLRPAYNMFTPANVCDAAYRGGDGDESIPAEDFAGWLPERYRSMSVAALREELRKLNEAPP